MTYVDRVGLRNYRDFYPSRLSQGMRQRVSLARAFAVGRSVYLMDEPFSALDSQTKLVLHDQLLKLWETSRSTVVFVTHDIGEAITLADRVVVMSKNGTGVVDEICVDLPRPRSADALQADARYHDLVSKNLDLPEGEYRMSDLASSEASLRAAAEVPANRSGSIIAARVLLLIWPFQSGRGRLLRGSRIRPSYRRRPASRSRCGRCSGVVKSLLTSARRCPK